MNRPGRTCRQYGTKRRTQDQKRVALLSNLTFRRSLDGLTGEGLALSFGVNLNEAIAALEAERARRAEQTTTAPPGAQ